MNLDILLNDFAIRSFRETGDGDYIAARLSYRAQLIPQFLWLSLQVVEKYLKCVLVLNRIRAPKSHNLADLLCTFEHQKKFDLRISVDSAKFIEYLDTYGRHRYYETPYYAAGGELFALDKVAWEIRRYARVLNYKLKTLEGTEIDILPLEIAANEAAEGHSPRRFSIMGGRLESILEKKDHPSRPALVWQNAFFGKSRRKGVWHPSHFVSGNSPLSLHPEVLDEVLKYVFLPKDVIAVYRSAA